VRFIRGGRGEPFTNVPYFWSDQHGVRIQFAGYLTGEEETGDSRTADGSLFLYRRDGVATGVLAFDRRAEFARLRALLRRELGWHTASELVCGKPVSVECGQRTVEERCADQQVIVVGAGPTGLLNALGLARQRVEVTVVERASGIQDSPRAIVYHWATLDGLARLGVLDDAARAGFLKQDYAYRLRRTGEIIEYGPKALEGKAERPCNLHLGQGALARPGRPCATPSRP
jgi:hypothetical protein